MSSRLLRSYLNHSHPLLISVLDIATCVNLRFPCFEIMDRRSINYKNNTFCFYKSLANGVNRWRCRKRNGMDHCCSAFIKTIGPEHKVIFEQLNHVHGITRGEEIDTGFQHVLAKTSLNTEWLSEAPVAQATAGAKIDGSMIENSTLADEFLKNYLDAAVQM